MSRFATMHSPMKLGVSIVLALLLSACSGEQSNTFVTQISPDAQAWEFSPPQSVLNRAVDPSQLNPRVTINGRSVNVDQPNDASPIYRGVVPIPEGESVSLSVEWIEFFRSRELLLAVLERDFPAITSDTNVVLFEDDYVTDDVGQFPRLDDDNDRVSNLAERVENSDPLSALDPGATRANAFLIPISPENAPIIDGSFDLIWGQAQYQDRDRDELSIDNRMIGFDPDRPDQNTEFRWGGLHDGRFLYLLVFGESSENRTTQGDSSAEPWMDDAIDIFWDGNRSRGQTYDGVDDYHLIIPLTKLNSGLRNASNLSDGSLDPDGRAVTGFNSVDIIDLEGVRFSNCVCPGSDIYEIRLDMELFGIPQDRSFGFDIQINNDIDGNERDFKFGWQAPSAADGVAERDETWRNPSLMGLVELISSEETLTATASSEPVN